MKKLYEDVSVPEENCSGCNFFKDKNSNEAFPYGIKGLNTEQYPYFCTLFFKDLNGTNKCDTCEKAKSGYDVALSMENYAKDNMGELLPKLALTAKAISDFYNLMRWDNTQMTDEQYSSLFPLVRKSEDFDFFENMDLLLKFMEKSIK